MRVLICGGRDWNDQHVANATLTIHTEIDRLLTRYGTALVLIHGDEPNGADTIARNYAHEKGVPHMEYCAKKPRPALSERHTVTQVSDWAINGKAAGIIRNRIMLEEGKPAGVVAFSTGGPGTSDMIDRAFKARLPVIVYKAEPIAPRRHEWKPGEE